jgi:hypothetical protein
MMAQYSEGTIKLRINHDYIGESDEIVVELWTDGDSVTLLRDADYARLIVDCAEHQTEPRDDVHEMKCYRGVEQLVDRKRRQCRNYARQIAPSLSACRAVWYTCYTLTARSATSTQHSTIQGGRSISQGASRSISQGAVLD